LRLLREFGVYELPSGARFVACREGARHLLYDPQARAWECGDPPDGEVDEGGRVWVLGRLTGWTADDLKDTGWTAYRAV
jgi:hypothetical protein